MTWTYGNDPTASDVAAVRFVIQDTDENAPLLQDEEIEYAILMETTVAATVPQTITPPNLYLAAAQCMEALTRRFTAQADTTIGQLATVYSKQALAYALRAAEMRAKAAGGFAPQSTGRCRPPAFTVDEFDNPYVDRGDWWRNGGQSPGWW